MLATNGFAQPNEFGVLLSLQILVGAAVAGPRLALGRPRRGGVFVALLPDGLRRRAPLIGSAHGQDVVFGLIVIVVMLLLPTGVAGLLPRLRRLRARA